MGKLKSCSSCGRIHAVDYICAKKEASIQRYRQQRKDRIKGQKDLRFTRKWKKKAAEIKQRDLHLCQMCTRNLDMLTGMKVYNYLGTQVHHIVSIKEDESKAFDNDNLITLCRYHHELVENNKKYIEILQEIAKEQEIKEENTSPPY